MNLEEGRLENLVSYQIMETSNEQELDELAEIASLICDTPISLITLVDKDRIWFKANKGLDASGAPRKDSFCHHAIHNPKEILVVNDSLKDDRFINSPLAQGNPSIRFYAGAPLETPDGHVLGTLCILDYKPRTISLNQQKALKLLAKKTMEYLNARKVIKDQETKIESSVENLKKLTDSVPGGIFQLKVSAVGDMKFELLSEGIKRLHPTIDLTEWKNDPTVGFRLVHPEDLKAFRESLELSFHNVSIWHHEYRVISGNGFHWHQVKAEPEKLEDGSVVWYGSFQDITSHIEYEKTMEQIAFDISHVLRKPVTGLMGLTSLIAKEKDLNEISIKEYSGHILTVANELEKFTHELNDVYQKQKVKISNRNNGFNS